MLLAEDGDHLRLADFGTAKNTSQISKNLTRDYANGNMILSNPSSYSRGTEGYRAPEIEKEEVYDGKADVFSLGRSIWEMIHTM